MRWNDPDAMTSMTNVKHKTSEQHMELGTSRSNRDFADLHNIQQWLNQHEPFDLNEPRLRSLSFGLMASGGDGVNCDKTEEVGDSLNGLRYAKYMEMVSTSKKSIDPQKLPPTERAAYFHSLRVHLQVILWFKLTNNDLDPMQWGWKLADTVLTPVLTDLDAAPESLLKFVRCKCELSARNPCGNNSCSCRKHGLKCVTACGDCRGDSCQTAEEFTLDDEDNVDTNEEIVFQ